MRTLIVVVAAVALVQCAFAQPVQWAIEDGGNGHFYEYISGDFSWIEARDYAYAQAYLGYVGYLATISSAEENDFIITNTGLVRPAWLGAYQLEGSVEPDQGWQWITGEPWDFTYWCQGEPSNRYAEDGSNAAEDYLNYHPGSCPGMWNDFPLDPEYYDVGVVIEYGEGVVNSDVSTWSCIKSTYR